MKPVAFDYRRAGSVEEACALKEEDPSALFIAGGQSLMPMLAMRLARPSRVIDILRVPGLDAIRLGETHVELGATARQATVENSRTIAETVPLLFRAMPWVGHPPTRRRGTVGGSLANADPTAEIGLVGVALGAELVLAEADGARQVVPVQEFLVAPMVTSLPPGAMVAGVRFPRRGAGRRAGAGFAEVAERHGDYAIAAAAAEVVLDADGGCAEISAAVGGATAVPMRLALAGLIGTRLEDAAVRSAVAAGLEGAEMMEDPKASAAYRRRAAIALAAKAIGQARDEAMGAADG
jgi:CO/xanthine dehydrogenase FAD-binding subunit